MESLVQHAPKTTTAAIVYSPQPAKMLSSVVAGIYDQSLPPSEIIVVRPGGNRDLDEWRGRPGFRVLSAEGVNGTAARNIALGAATADLIAFFDDDSVPDFGWFEELLRVFADEGRCAAAGGATIDETRHERSLVFRNGVIATDGQLDPIRLEAGPSGGDGSRNVLDRANMLCSRAALLDVGGFDEAFEATWAGHDLCLRLSNAGYAVLHHTRALVHLLRARALPADDSVLATAARDRTYFLRKHGGKNPLEAARTVLQVAREQQRTLRRAGADEPARRVFRAWAEGVRLGMELPAPLPERRVAPPTTTTHLVWRPVHAGAVAPSRWQIALICGVFEAGHNGISEYTRLLAESFTERGHGVTVFRTNRGPPLVGRRPYDVIDVQPRAKELYAMESTLSKLPSGSARLAAQACWRRIQWSRGSLRPPMCCIARRKYPWSASGPIKRRWSACSLASRAA
jgi:GT2 family glycosyltransferase